MNNTINKSKSKEGNSNNLDKNIDKSSKLLVNNINEKIKNLDKNINKSSELLVDNINEKFKNLEIYTKNKGAGGANTTKNGLAFEKITKLTLDKNEENIIDTKNNFISKKIGSKNFVVLSKNNLKKYMEENNQKNKNIIPASGCKQPDEAYLDEELKNLFIIEKKFQKCGGSVDEKLQTAHFKIKHYKKLYQNYNIYYVYCLSNWFKRDEYKDVLSYNEEIGVKILWQENYQENILQYIISKS